MSDISRQILAFCTQNKEALLKCVNEIDHLQFEETPEKLVFFWVTNHWKKHESLLSSAVLDKYLDKDKVNKFEMSDQIDAVELLDEVKAMSTNSEDFQFYLDEFKIDYTKRMWKSLLSTNMDDDGIFHEGLMDIAERDPWKAYEIFQKEIGKHMEIALRDGRAETNAVHEIYDDWLDEYETIELNPELAYGIKTGYSYIDEATLGVKPGELFLFGGRHGSGKSIFLLNAAVNAYKAEKNVLIVSIEMPKKQYFERFLACYADLPIKEIQTARLAPEQKKTMKNIGAEIKHKWNHGQQYLLIADIPNVTANTVRAEVNQAVTKCGFKPDLVIVDYLGIMKSIDKEQADWQEQTKAAEELRELGRTENLAMISAVQLNRDGKKGTGTQRIARADGIGATCDVFIQIIEPGENETDENASIMDLDDTLEVELVKNRKGEGGLTFQLYKNFANMVIRNKDTYRPHVERELESLEEINTELSKLSVEIESSPSTDEESAEDQNLREGGEFIDP